MTHSSDMDEDAPDAFRREGGDEDDEDADDGSFS